MLLTVLAVVLFVLAAVGAVLGSWGALNLIAAGLAVYALGRIVP